MATKIATLKAATPLTNAIGVWTVGTNCICLAEEDAQGNALIGEALVLKPSEEAALLDLLQARALAQNGPPHLRTAVKANLGGYPYVEVWDDRREKDAVSLQRAHAIAAKLAQLVF